MTIIQPNHNKHRINLVIFTLSVGLVLCVGLEIYVYNTLVNLNHNVGVLSESIKKAEVANADNKNKIFQILDPRTLEVLAQKNGLIKDKATRYFELTSNLP